MNGSLNLVTGPTVEPVSLAEAKLHLRVDINDDDVFISSLVETVRIQLERQYDTAFVNQSWDWYLDTFPNTSFEIPLWPLSSVTSIKYTDEDDSESTYSSDNYRVDTASKPGRVILKTAKSWPSVTLKEHNGVVIRFVAGYGAGSTSVPAPIRQAIKLMVGDLYENRENVLIAQGVTVSNLQIERVLMANYRGFNV